MVFLAVRATAESILDLLHLIMSTTPPAAPKFYEEKALTERDIFNIVKSHIPSVASSTFTPRIVNRLLTNDAQFGPSQNIRELDKVKKGRNVWLMKPDVIGKLKESTHKNEN